MKSVTLCWLLLADHRNSLKSEWNFKLIALFWHALNSCPSTGPRWKWWTQGILGVLTACLLYFRSNGTTQGNPGMMGNGKGSGVSPKSSPLGQQYPPHTHPPKHANHANHASSSRLGPQSHAHYGLLQPSPEASLGTEASLGQAIGESVNHIPNGHLTQAQWGRHSGPNHHMSGFCPPGGAVSNMWSPTSTWVQVGTDPNISSWGQAGYSQPYAQNSSHGSSSMSKFQWCWNSTKDCGAVGWMQIL